MIDPSYLWPWVRDQLATATGLEVFLAGDTQGRPAMPYLVVTPAFPAFDEQSLLLRSPTYGIVLQIDAVGRSYKDCGAGIAAADIALRALAAPLELGVAAILVEAATSPGESDADEVVAMSQLFRVLFTEVAA